MVRRAGRGSCLVGLSMPVCGACSCRARGLWIVAACTIVPRFEAMWLGPVGVSYLLVVAGVWICCVGCKGCGVVDELVRTLLGLCC